MASGFLFPFTTFDLQGPESRLLPPKTFVGRVYTFLNPMRHKETRFRRLTLCKTLL